MITWPQNLIQDIARRKAVIFLGSGISRNSISRDGTTRPPTWDNFLRIAMQQVQGPTAHISELLNEKDYLTACELIYDRPGEVNFNDLAASAFLRPGCESHQIHESIYKLDSRIVATPNVD
ncbi:SIR2 family protein, partial [Clostridium perfringens]